MLASQAEYGSKGDITSWSCWYEKGGKAQVIIFSMFQILGFARLERLN